MRAPFGTMVVVLAGCVLELTPRSVWAQAAPANPQSIYEPVLDQSDEDEKEVYTESHVAFHYRHDWFDEGLRGDEVRTHWQQAMGLSGRMAFGIEVPLINVRDVHGGESTTGTGDIQLDFRGVIGKYERFEHAVGVGALVASSSHEDLDDGQTVLGAVWGCSAQITDRNTLDAIVRYKRGIYTKWGMPKRNNLGADVIATHAFTPRLAAYFEADGYYEFSQGIEGYAQTLKAGTEVIVDSMKKWSLSPYVLIPITHTARILETGGAAGIDLAFRY
jgi:hypothetical protein